MTNVPFINSITNELSKRKLKSAVVANAILDIAVGNDRLDDLIANGVTQLDLESLTIGGLTTEQTAEPFIVRGDTVVLTSTANPIGMTIQYAVNGHEGGGNLCDSQNIIVPNKGINYVIDNFAVSFSTYTID